MRCNDTDFIVLFCVRAGKKGKGHLYIIRGSTTRPSKREEKSLFKRMNSSSFLFVQKFHLILLISWVLK